MSAFTYLATIRRGQPAELPTWGKFARTPDQRADLVKVERVFEGERVPLGRSVD